jgi:uncharacterized protein (DUF983 family)
MPSRSTALLRCRCPRCLEGPIFRGIFAMHPNCPRCGQKLGIEAGYFLGSMILGYAVAVPLLGLLTFALQYFVLTEWPLHWVLFPAAGLFLPLVPFIFRYSRAAWIHLEWVALRGRKTGS